MKKIVVLVATFLLHLELINVSEAVCEGTLGQIENLFYTRNDTIYITWAAPLGWQNCEDLKYEITFRDYANNAIFFTDTVATTKYDFNYAAEHFYCQIFNIGIVPKYNYYLGDVWDTIVVGDNFTSAIIDPVENLQIRRLVNYMYIRWDPPSHFKACWALHYNAEVHHEGVLIKSWSDNSQFLSIDYSALNLCNSTLQVTITAAFRNFQTTPISQRFKTGSC